MRNPLRKNRVIDIATNPRIRAQRAAFVIIRHLSDRRVLYIVYHHHPIPLVVQHTVDLNTTASVSFEQMLHPTPVRAFQSRRVMLRLPAGKPPRTMLCSVRFR